MPSNDATQAPEPTICVKCEHILPQDPASALYPKCEANPETDYVTGRPQHMSCWRKNDKGTCPDYEEAKDE